MATVCQFGMAAASVTLRPPKERMGLESWNENEWFFFQVRRFSGLSGLYATHFGGVQLVFFCFRKIYSSGWSSHFPKSKGCWGVRESCPKIDLRVFWRKIPGQKCVDFLPRYLGCGFPPSQFQWQMGRWIFGLPRTCHPGDESWNHPKVSQQHLHFWLSLMIFFHSFLTQNWRIFRLLCNAFNGSSSPSTSGILQRSL